MRTPRQFISGLGLGATLMYVFDPYVGNRRRARARDQIIHTLHKASEGMSAATRDLSNRMRGTASSMRSKLTGSSAPDQVLEARVRSEMGRVISHPRAISVSARQGRIRLRGPILRDEVDALLACAASVRGVKEVIDELDVHRNNDDIPSLQGRGRIQARQARNRAAWRPSTRLIASVGGGVLAVYGALRRDGLGAGLSALGVGLTTRAITNKPARRLLGIDSGHRAVDIQKTIEIGAPVEDVFSFWENVENFPHFMRNVLNVTDRGDGRSHWTVRGPAGATVNWEAETTEWVPNELIAWKTIAGPTVENAGFIRFTPTENGGTRLHIRLSYNPPGGAIGHAIATLFGSDAKTELDEDLARMKTMIETGRPPRDASQSSSGHEEAVDREQR